MVEIKRRSDDHDSTFANDAYKPTASICSRVQRAASHEHDITTAWSTISNPQTLHLIKSRGQHGRPQSRYVRV